MRVIVTGSREFHSRSAVWGALDCLVREGLTIVHGGARGADSFADQWAAENDVQVEQHSAEWSRYGKLAGGIRNQKMVDMGADLCIAFLQPGAANVGTRNCMTAARLSGIEVQEVWG